MTYSTKQQNQKTSHLGTYLCKSANKAVTCGIFAYVVKLVIRDRQSKTELSNEINAGRSLNFMCALWR